MRRVIITLTPDSPSSARWVVEEWTDDEGCVDRVVHDAFDHMSTDLLGTPLDWKDLLNIVSGHLV